MSTRERPKKRHRRAGARGDTVESSHKDLAAREAARNSESKKRAQEVSKLLRDEKSIKEEIEKLKQETDKDNSKAIKALEGALTKLTQDSQRRLAKQEQESEYAIKRKIAAGHIVGPAPPPGDPPRRGPGFPPPIPPPFRELPIPQPPSIPPAQSIVQRVQLDALRAEQIEAAARLAQMHASELIAQQKLVEEEQQRNDKASGAASAQAPKKLFMPTSVAVQMKKSQ